MRIGIGLAALTALLVAAVLAINGDETTAGIAARIGIVMAAGWIAYPVVTDLGPRTYLFVGLGAVILLWRPRSALVVLPFLAYALRRRPDDG